MPVTGSLLQVDRAVMNDGLLLAGMDLHRQSLDRPEAATAGRASTSALKRTVMVRSHDASAARCGAICGRAAIAGGGAEHAIERHRGEATAPIMPPTIAEQRASTDGAFAAGGRIGMRRALIGSHPARNGHDEDQHDQRTSSTPSSAQVPAAPPALASSSLARRDPVMRRSSAAQPRPRAIRHQQRRTAGRDRGSRKRNIRRRAALGSSARRAITAHGAAR